MALEQVELAVRLAATVPLVLLAILLGWRARGALRWLGPVFALAVASYLWCPVIYGRWGADRLATPLPYVGCVTAAAWLWMFSRAMLDERFRPGPVHWAAAAALLGLAVLRDLAWAGAAAPSGPAALAEVAPQFLSIAIIVVALVQAARGRADDLVPGRRTVRDALVALAGAYALGIVVVEVFLRGARAAPWVEVANVAAILLMTCGAILAFVRLRADMVPQAARTDAAAPPSDADRALADALARAMDEDKAYREEGLTIGALAARLGCQEHRLRRVINRGLGHRNFARYVNGYRLAEAKARLADPAERAPVLTIALEAGFGSIGPFNRAFKDDTGLTPVEYRRRHGAAPPKS